MMSTKNTSARRLFARVALTGALVVTPLAAVAATASADPGTGPAITDVRHPHGNDRDCDNWKDRDRWDHRNDRWWDDDCDRRNDRHHDRDNDGWRNSLPRGWFGSS
ncbi:hypothetical protein JK358_37040 [Nocardia sp. 2]|uniref:Secreted protein n=1 Tax=Nocardia acididurans TaxID=2802282 RepID=A0ABS1MHH6_9NOCA|nr:hypothetical protein [Nocardia acididurans]MBL1080017.1 hypothetical protein [Nocardia acididurans]